MYTKRKCKHKIRDALVPTSSSFTSSTESNYLKHAIHSAPVLNDKLYTTYNDILVAVQGIDAGNLSIRTM